MQKPAPADFPVHQLIRDRWSPRSFAGKAIPEDVLRSLFEAVRWAPSSNNEQPWAYIVATKDDPATLRRSSELWWNPTQVGRRMQQRWR